MLADQGIIISQLGKAPSPGHRNENIDDILASLEAVGMESFHQYALIIHYFFIF